MAIQIPTELLDGSVLGILNHGDYYGYALTQKVQADFPIFYTCHAYDCTNHQTRGA